MECNDSNTEFHIDCDNFDIIIIGGGLTGLTAAYNILKKRAGQSVLIIEQQDRIGGHINCGDIGFYAHTFQKHISRLVEQLNLVRNFSEPNDNKQRIFFTKNGPDSQNKISTIDACQVFYFIKLLHTICMESRFNAYSKTEFESRKIAEMSVNDFLQQTVMSASARSLCQSIIYTVCGVNNLDNVSCLWLFVMLHNAGGFFQRFKVVMSNNTRYFIEGGMMNLIKCLRDKIIDENGIINCSEVVKKINFSDIRIWITTSLKTYKCNYVIIAVPPPASDKIIIEPILSESIQATQSLYYRERNVYFQAKYKSSFWQPKYTGNIISTADSMSNLKIVYNVSHKEEEGLYMLAGFLNETSSESTKSLNIFQTLNKSFEALDINANKYLQYNEYKSFNAIAVVKPCSIEYHNNPMLTPLKRIYIAASDYARKFPGTADGAIEAGEHVAYFVLHHVRPQVLTISELMEYIPPKIPPKYQFPIEEDWACAILLIANAFIFFTFLRRAYM